MSYTFTLTGTESILVNTFYPPITLDNNKNYAIGLINLESYNSFPNIDNSNNKFYFVTDDGEEAVIEIPEGSYEIDDIEAYLNKELSHYSQYKVVDKKSNDIEKNGGKRRKINVLQQPVIRIRGNNNTLKSEVKCTLDIDFSKENSVGSLLGFRPQKLKANINYVSNYPTKILKLNALCIECNIVAGSYRDGKQVHVIHEFFPAVPPGFKIIETPSNVIYLPINTKQIDEIVLKITDEKSNLVNFRGEVVTVRLHLHQVK